MTDRPGVGWTQEESDAGTDTDADADTDGDGHTADDGDGDADDAMMRLDDADGGGDSTSCSIDGDPPCDGLCLPDNGVTSLTLLDFDPPAWSFSQRSVRWFALRGRRAAAIRGAVARLEEVAGKKTAGASVFPNPAPAHPTRPAPPEGNPESTQGRLDSPAIARQNIARISLCPRGLGWMQSLASHREGSSSS